jgi:hypothetical protein
MKSKLLRSPALLLPVIVASCAPLYSPPRPIGPRTGVSLDNSPNGERSARQTRYLEEDYVPPPTISENPPLSQGPDTGLTPADPNAPATPPAGTNPAAPQPPATGSDKTAEKPPATTPAPAPELPFGSPVPGKKGFVYSPFDKSAGFVDVRDIAPGTKVRCPYTGKIFKVP